MSNGGVHSKTRMHQLSCNMCGTVTYIWRLRSRRKEFGHIKHVYCTECKDVTAHTDDGPV